MGFGPNYLPLALPLRTTPTRRPRDAFSLLISTNHGPIMKGEPIFHWRFVMVGARGEKNYHNQLWIPSHHIGQNTVKTDILLASYINLAVKMYSTKPPILLQPASHHQAHGDWSVVIFEESIPWLVISFRFISSLLHLCRLSYILRWFMEMLFLHFRPILTNSIDHGGVCLACLVS